MNLPGRGLFARPWVRLACAVLATTVLGLTVWAAGARAVLAGLGGQRPRLAGAGGARGADARLQHPRPPRPLRQRAPPFPRRASGCRPEQPGTRWDWCCPMGRSSAEATRAILLGRSVGGPRAAVAAVQMQGVTLLSNAALRRPRHRRRAGASRPGDHRRCSILANGLVAAVLGAGILVVRQRARPGRLARGGRSGDSSASGWHSMPTAGASRGDLLRAGAWECVARAAPRPCSAGSPWPPSASPPGRCGRWSPGAS